MRIVLSFFLFLFVFLFFLFKWTGSEADFFLGSQRREFRKTQFVGGKYCTCFTALLCDKFKSQICMLVLHGSFFSLPLSCSVMSYGWYFASRKCIYNIHKAYFHERALTLIGTMATNDYQQVFQATKLYFLSSFSDNFLTCYNVPSPLPLLLFPIPMCTCGFSCVRGCITAAVTDAAAVAAALLLLWLAFISTFFVRCLCGQKVMKYSNTQEFTEMFLSIRASLFIP